LIDTGLPVMNAVRRYGTVQCDLTERIPADSERLAVGLNLSPTDHPFCRPSAFCINRSMNDACGIARSWITSPAVTHDQRWCYYTVSAAEADDVHQRRHCYTWHEQNKVW